MLSLFALLLSSYDEPDDEAMKVKSEWRMFARKIANAEKVAQEKKQQVQQMNAQIEKSKAGVGRKWRRIDSCHRNIIPT